MASSGEFRFVREILFYQTEAGDADRLTGLALSQGSVAALLRHGLAEEEIGLTGIARYRPTPSGR